MTRAREVLAGRPTPEPVVWPVLPASRAAARPARPGKLVRPAWPVARRAAVRPAPPVTAAAVRPAPPVTAAAAWPAPPARAVRPAWPAARRAAVPAAAARSAA